LVLGEYSTIMIKLVDIAHELNLSRITVSAVLNNRHKSLGITDATAQRVIKKADEMGYRRNQHAMAINTGRSHTFGIILGADHFEDWLGQTIKGAFDAVHDSDYNIKLEFLPEGGSETKILNTLLGQRVEGIFGLDLHPEETELLKIKKAIEKHSVPFLCSNSTPDLSPTGLEPDHSKGMHLALEHLTQLGHRSIAYIGGGEVTTAGIKRNEAFKNFSREMGLNVPEQHFQLSHWDLDKAEEYTEDMLTGNNPPTAIIGANDQIAVVVIRRARKLGIQVPRDLSVIGFSNEFISEVSDPPLTVVDMHHDIIGRRALESLLKHAEGPNRSKALADGQEKISASLIVRKSTAEPAK